MKEENIERGCLEIIEHLLKRGFSYQVARRELENAIILCNKGIDERTWKRWIRALEVFEYLKLIDKNLYEMNVSKVPNLFAILKNTPQTHLSTPSLSQNNDARAKVNPKKS